jgi:hypothetical protein
LSTVVIAVAVLFAVFGSAVVPVTDTTLLTEPSFDGI